MAWTVETLNPTVDRELAGLPADQRAKFVRIAQLIEAKGLDRVREPAAAGDPAGPGARKGDPMTSVERLHARWLKDPAYRAAHDALDDEFALAAALIDARSRADLTQAEVARRMQTSQAYVAKMEGARINPSVKTLQRFAAATGSRLRITFERAEAE